VALSVSWHERRAREIQRTLPLRGARTPRILLRRQADPPHKHSAHWI